MIVHHYKIEGETLPLGRRIILRCDREVVGTFIYVEQTRVAEYLSNNLRSAAEAAVEPSSGRIQEAVAWEILRREYGAVEASKWAGRFRTSFVEKISRRCSFTSHDVLAAYLECRLIKKPLTHDIPAQGSFWLGDEYVHARRRTAYWRKRRLEDERESKVRNLDLWTSSHGVFNSLQSQKISPSS